MVCVILIAMSLSTASAPVSSATTSLVAAQGASEQRPILVVGLDRLATEAMAAAIDPMNVRSYPVSVNEALGRIAKGGVRVVVMLPRGLDPSVLLNVLRRTRGIHLIVAAVGVTTAPPEFTGVKPFLAGSLDDVLKQVHQFVALTTELALTGRHVDILQRLAQGDTPTEAASSLGITVKTLNNHLGVIYRRLGTRNVTQAVLMALRAGLVEL
jgi:DNA-binding CsgD family transcriptional regulator